MKPVLQFRQNQQLNLTPELRQSIRFLQLPSADLSLEIRAIIDRNIALEATDDDGLVDEPVEVAAAADERSSSSERPWSDPHAGIAAPMDWRTSLQRQIDVAHFDEATEVLARAIIDSLDDDGYLRQPLAEVAGLIGVSGTQWQWLSVLQRVQQLDPIGIAARDLSEYLGLQLRAFHGTDSRCVLALALIAGGLEAIAAWDILALAARTGADESAVAAALELIRTLSPRPVSGEQLPATGAAVPDVLLWREHRRWVVVAARGVLPGLRVPPGLEQLMGESAECRNHEALRSQVNEARWLLRALAMREETLLKVTRAIVARQRGFFERGLDAMVALTLREIADDIGMHESTVSRVTSGKYLQSPVGTFELKYFFTAQLKTDDGFGCSAQTVRARIRSMVDAEAPFDPLSDSAIAGALARDGIRVARRTVGKYREQLGILSVAERTRHNQAVARRSALLSRGRLHERMRVSGT